MPSGSRGGQHLLRCSLQIIGLAGSADCMSSQPTLPRQTSARLAARARAYRLPPTRSRSGLDMRQHDRTALDVMKSTYMVYNVLVFIATRVLSETKRMEFGYVGRFFQQQEL
jgi:hypothetical protein